MLLRSYPIEIHVWRAWGNAPTEKLSVFNLPIYPDAEFTQRTAAVCVKFRIENDPSVGETCKPHL